MLDYVEELLGVIRGDTRSLLWRMVNRMDVLAFLGVLPHSCREHPKHAGLPEYQGPARG